MKNVVALVLAIALLVHLIKTYFLHILVVVMIIGCIYVVYRISVDKLWEQVSPKFVDFTDAYMGKCGLWPQEVVIEVEDVKAFTLLLKRECNVNIAESAANKFVMKALEISKQRLFSKSFVSIFPTSKFDYRNNEWLIDAYIEVFGMNQNYIDYLFYLAKENGNQNLNLSTLRVLIKRKVEYVSNNRKVEKIKSFMEKSNNSTKITINDVDKMSGLEFEGFLDKLFSKMGYISKMTKASGDQGADLILEKFGEKTAVQVKCYSGNVDNKAVQEVIAAKSFYSCHKALVVTNSTFTRSACEIAQKAQVELWDRAKLHQAILEYW